jgi:hypothetical protein
MARPLLIAAIVLTAVAAGARAQIRFAIAEPPLHNLHYDGRFAFARIKYQTGPGGYYYYGLPAWAHGYPNAEHNMVSILREISAVDAHADGSNVLALDDPEFFKYPLAYMSEAGYWTMGTKEAAALRAYLRKGGFIVFDDFRNDRGNDGWGNFEANLRRVFPDARFIDLDASHPIFHTFFEIGSLDIVPQFYDQGRPVFRGLFEDNDPEKRLLAIINFNTDVSNFWEFSSTGLKPIDESNEAYKLGVNYFLYGMTH